MGRLDVQHGRVNPKHSRVGDDRKHDLCRTRELTVDGRFRVDPAAVAFVTQPRYFHVQPGAGYDRATKLCFVDAGEVWRLAREFTGFEDHRATELRERFNHINAG